MIVKTVKVDIGGIFHKNWSESHILSCLIIRRSHQEKAWVMNLTERGESFDEKTNNYNVIATSNGLNQSSRESQRLHCLLFKHGVMHDKPKFAIAQCNTYVLPFHGIFFKRLLKYFWLFFRLLFNFLYLTQVTCRAP